MYTRLAFFLCVTLSVFSFASNLQPNQGPVHYKLQVTSGDGQGATLDLSLNLKSGDFTGTANITPRTKIDFGGAVKGYYENGHCVLNIAGPNGRTLELRGDCDTATYSGHFTSHGRGEYVSGNFSGSGATAAKPAIANPQIPLPKGKLTCGYMSRNMNGSYEFSFSSIGSITLNPDGTYITGSGVRGSYVREGDKVRLTSGRWKGYIAGVELDRSGDPKLVFHSVDPGATSCTSPRK